MRSSHWPAIALLLVTLGSLTISASPAQAQTGSHNPITAAPPVSRPTTQSCVVTLLQGVSFTKGYTPFVGKYSPPGGCPAPWSKVVLNWTGSVSEIQYDRIGAMWIGGVEFLRTSTPEPPNATINWTVAKDVTEYYSILQSPQTVTVIVSNSLTASNPGAIVITATLTFYETSSTFPTAPHPDVVVPVSSSKAAGSSAPWFDIASGAAGTTVTLPQNIVRAYIEVYATPHSCEEFWYSNQTTPWDAPYGLCGGTAFREIQVSVDGTLVGVVWPFPIIYTGGISPLLWEVVPGVNAFDIPAYVINVTPFIGMLESGKQQNVTFTVVNNSGYWRIDANFLLYTDATAQKTSGSLLANNMAPEPTEVVTESVAGNAETINPGTPFLCPSVSAGTCLFNTEASRSFTVSGSVTGSLGVSKTTITQTMSFSNDQALNLANGLEDLLGDQAVNSTTTTTNSTGTFVQRVVMSYPLVLDSAEIIPTNEHTPFIFFEPTAVNQTLLQNVTDLVGGRTTFASSTSDAVSAQAFLKGSLLTGEIFAADGSSSEHYVYSDSTSACYNVFLDSSQDALTADVTSPTC